MKKALVICPHLSTGGSCEFTLNKIKMLLSSNLIVYVIEYNFLSADFVVQRNKIKKLLNDQHFENHNPFGYFYSYDSTEIPYVTKNGKNGTYYDIIQEIKPDYIFLEENPIMFIGTRNILSKELTSLIYSCGAKVFETTHDSSFGINVTDLSFKTFVSPYSYLQFIEADGNPENAHIIEYPIDVIDEVVENNISKNKEIKKSYLGWNNDNKHVVIIGLFTPRKNQAYAIELAKKLIDKNVIFHFIGNMADNFRDYWQPLVDNKPENCVFHGEKSNVIDYLMAADLFLFCSQGNNIDKELNPLVIREAMRIPSLPKLIFNLDVYLKRYDNAPNMHFLDGNEENDAQKIIELLSIINTKNKPIDELVNTKNMNTEITDIKDFTENLNVSNNNHIPTTAIVIGAFPNNLNREKLTIECIYRLKVLNLPIYVASHFPVSEQIVKEVDGVIFDKYNPITTHSYYQKFWNETDDHYAEINLCHRPLNQSLCVLNNIKNGLAFAVSKGHRNIMYINYDVLFDHRDIDSFKKYRAQIHDNWVVACERDTSAGKGLETTSIFLSSQMLGFLYLVPSNSDEYNNYAKQIGAENYLEHFLYKAIIDAWKAKALTRFYTNNENTLLQHSGLGIQSCSEYVELLPVENHPDKVCLYSFSYNTDNRIRKFFTYRISDSTPNEIMQHDLTKSNFCYTILDKSTLQSEEISNFIELEDHFSDGSKSVKTRIHTNDFWMGIIDDNGIFRFKMKEQKNDSNLINESESIYIEETQPKNNDVISAAKKPRIRLVHLLLDVDSISDDVNIIRVQQNSHDTLKKITDYGWEYIPFFNQPYISIPPSHNCLRPDDVEKEGALVDEKTLTGAHYGCYEAFKNAVLAYLNNDIDLLVVCEGDCKLEVPINEFVEFVENNIYILNENAVGIISYGDKNALETGVLQSEKIRPINDYIYRPRKIIGLQCIGFLPAKKDRLIDMFINYPWDAMDILINQYFAPNAGNELTLAIVENRLTSQYDGYSYIEKREKKFL